jgi:tetraacyldisaccharide 4'-kinase
MQPGGWRAALAARLVRDWALPRRTPLCRLLQPLGWLYGVIAALHRGWWQRHGHAERHPGVPVLVVGNLVAGGAGKTPTVIHLVNLLRQHGWHPGVVSRGHGGRATAPTEVKPDGDAAQVGDEPLLIHLRSGVPLVVARQRLAAARHLRALHPDIDVIVADDGLQHHALARDAQVIVFDERGAGNGLLLPAGPLREPMGAQPPPRSVVLYAQGQASTPWPGHAAHRKLGGVLPLADWWRGQAAGPLAALRGRPLLAAAGLARPEPFFDMLAREGLQISRLPLPDHHDYRTLPWPADTPDVVLTEKDAVKIRPGTTGATRVWVATLDFRPEAGFDDAVLHTLPPRPSH